MVKTGKQLAKELIELGAYKQYCSDGITGRGIYWLIEYKGQVYRLSRKPNSKITIGMIDLAIRIKGGSK